MYFRLCLALGKDTTDRLAPHEFAEWCAFYELEPWGCMADDQRWRQHYNLFWSVNAADGRDPPDWLPRYPKPEPDVDPLEAWLDARAAKEDDDSQ